MIVSGPLVGLKVVELASIGPAPFCAMVLSDMGAEVIRVDRSSSVGSVEPPTHALDLGNRRGRRSVGVDLKHAGGREVVLRLVEQADVLLEGYRPGVAERLGVGPEECLARNARLVYGRMTGWGQSGPMAQAPGHDLNYLALTGLLHTMGEADSRPMPPLNLIGDFGGGGLLLAFGVVCAVLEAARSGQGQVIDAAMLDGAQLLGAMVHGMHQTGHWKDDREANRHDGGAPFYGTYETADGKWVAIAANEPQFYAVLVDALGLVDLPPQHEQESWPLMRKQFAEAFRTRTREDWVTALQGLETCFSPVLTLGEAREHEQNVVREGFVRVDGMLQPAPAPRLSRTPGAVQRPAARPGEHTQEALADWGFSPEELAALQAARAIVQR